MLVISREGSNGGSFIGDDCNIPSITCLHTHHHHITTARSIISRNTHAHTQKSHTHNHKIRTLIFRACFDEWPCPDLQATTVAADMGVTIAVVIVVVVVLALIGVAVDVTIWFVRARSD